MAGKIRFFSRKWLSQDESGPFTLQNNAEAEILQTFISLREDFETVCFGCCFSITLLQVLYSLFHFQEEWLRLTAFYIYHIFTCYLDFDLILRK